MSYRDARHPGVLRAQHVAALARRACRCGQWNAAAYYSTEPLRRTLVRAGRLPDALQPPVPMRLTVGRGERLQRCTMRYFDSRNETAGCAARDGLGCAAAGVSGGAHRRPAVLGRRHLLQHADRGRAGRQTAARFADLRRQRLAPDRARAGVDLAGDGPARKTSSTPAAPTATSRARKQIHRLRHVIRELERSNCRPRKQATILHVKELVERGAAAPRCTWRTCWRRGWKARTTPRTSTSPPGGVQARRLKRVTLTRMKHDRALALARSLTNPIEGVVEHR